MNSVTGLVVLWAMCSFSLLLTWLRNIEKWHRTYLPSILQISKYPRTKSYSAKCLITQKMPCLSKAIAPSSSKSIPPKLRPINYKHKDAGEGSDCPRGTSKAELRFAADAPCFANAAALRYRTQAKSLSTDTWMSGNANGALAKLNEVIASKC